MSKGFINFNIEGAEELEKALRALGSDPAVRSALKRAAIESLEPVAKDARARARRRSGNMAEGIDVTTQLSRRQRAQKTRLVGPLGVEAFVGAAPVGPAVLEEFGTTKRNWKSGKSTGHSPAHPFMRPAWEAGREKVLKDFSQILWVAIAQTAERLARKTARLRKK